MGAGRFSGKAAAVRKSVVRAVGAAVAAALVCVVYGAGNNAAAFVDKRDGKSYKTVKIGNQMWMAENLNYNAANSVCYDNKPANCTKYGRLYNWETAKEACPVGWHLPSDEE